MKKNVVIITIILVTILGVTFLISNSRYEKEELLNNFPIPKNATLLDTYESKYGKSKEINANLEWSRSSKKGIPFDYKITLMINGWKKVKEVEKEREEYWGGQYKKDDALVSIATTDPDILFIFTNKKSVESQ